MPNPNRTVLLKGQLGGRREEALAGGVISPGQLVEINSSGQAIRNTKVAGNIPIIVALEDPFRSRTQIDDYAVGDVVSLHYAKKNDKLFLRVPAAAAAVVVGDSLEPVSGGNVQKLAAGVRIAVAENAIDNSGGATVEWVKATIV